MSHAGLINMESGGLMKALCEPESAAGPVVG
jgi:hypothetical protein